MIKVRKTGLTNEAFADITYSYSVQGTFTGLRHCQVVAGCSVALLATC